jgi:hypothetical protein
VLLDGRGFDWRPEGSGLGLRFGAPVWGSGLGLRCAGIGTDFVIAPPQPADRPLRVLSAFDAQPDNAASQHAFETQLKP